MAFNALIHRHRPDLVDYYSLNPNDHIENLNKAFDIAQRELGVPRLLDAEDIDTNKPDEKSIMTYVSSYYHTFVKREKEIIHGRRIANIIAQLMEIDSLQYNYDILVSKLLSWINSKVGHLNDRNLSNSLEGIQNEMIKFKDYRTIEKPPKYRERIEIEALLFAIQTKMKSLGQPLYVPQEGKAVHDIEKAWNNLEKAEHNREVALREQMLRLERLENLAFRFKRKSLLREAYLKEMLAVLNDPRIGSNLTQIEATVKKHEAISADILARAERFESLSKIAQDLIDDNYHGKAMIDKHRNEIMTRWNSLLQLLAQHKQNLTISSNLMALLREVGAISAEIKDIQKGLTIDESAGGKHLSGVEDLLQKHSLIQAQITGQEETIKKLNTQSAAFFNDTKNSVCREVSILKQRLDLLNNEYQVLNELSKKRLAKLEEWRLFYQFVQDQEEEEAWIIERQRICQAVLSSKDLIGVIGLQQKHKALEAEIKAHEARIKKVIENGNLLIAQKYPEEIDIRNRIKELQEQWDHVHELAAQKRKQLEDANEAFQYYTDANEAESWIKEKMPLVKSEDYGKDETSAAALLLRHSRVESEIKAYENDIKRLNDQSECMIKSGLASLFMVPNSESSSTSSNTSTQEELVPTEEWVEEVVEKEIIQDVIEEVKVPQVRVLYSFSGQDGFEIIKNENLLLLQKTNNDWWNVRKADGRDGFAPANYVKEIDPKIIKKVIQQPVKVFEKQKVKKTVMKKVPNKSKRNTKRRLSIICDAEGITKRQNINTAFEELVTLSKERRQHLEDSVQLFSFNRECDNFESWIKEQENIMIETQKQHQQQMLEKQKKIASSTISDPVEVLRKKFENFLTDLSANKHRLENIDKMADEFTSEREQYYSFKIKERQKQIHESWNRINKLKNDLGKSVDGLTSVDLFDRICDDAVEWMTEKLEKMEYGESSSRDLKTIQALQRKHDNLQRELLPIKEKINKVNLLADSVKSSYPSEKKNVLKRQEELKEIWELLKKKAIEKRTKLDESRGLQVLKNSASDLLGWARSYVKQSFSNQDNKLVKDVATAEMFLKNHEDLGYEIASKNQDFHDLRELGTKLIMQKPNEEIRSILVELEQEQHSIQREWQAKDNWLKQCKDLMILNQEADHLDTITNSHQTYLEFDDLGTNLDDVIALRKRHDNFIATLVAQDDRLHLFNEMAEKLISAGHYNSANIEIRRKQVIDKRNNVKEIALQRAEDLKAARAYQEFKAEADEFISWCQEKIKTATDDLYKELTNMDTKLKKHETFEAELGSSHSRLVGLNKVGQQLIDNHHFASSMIKSSLENANSQWDELCLKANEKGKLLRQAIAQSTYNRKVENASVKLDEIEQTLASQEVGNDLRGCKEQIKKLKETETDLALLESRVTNLIKQGEEMAVNHFDGKGVLNACKEVIERLKKLNGPVKERKEKLMESLKYHQLAYEINAELQWVKDHELSVKSNDVGQNLTDAQNYSKKHQKLEREVIGHQPQVEKALANGQTLIDQNHFNNEKIASICAQLKDKWQSLLELFKDRRTKLDTSLKSQTFFSEANEVEAWISEKHDILNSNDFGKDENAAVKYLTKHKALELEIDTYSGLIKEMRHQAVKMIQNGSHPDERVIMNRMEDIEGQIKKLQQLSTERRNKLIESKHCHEYFHETEDFMKWISDQMQTAMSEGYGHDYEHLLVLQSKFKDFKRRIEACCERYNQCEEMYKKLSNSDIGGNIEGRQQELRKAWTLLLDHTESRDEQLKAAGELHRFNRDVAEARSRIQEKYSVLSLNDLGKDFHSVQSLLRKHEGFENDLVALEAQLQILIDDCTRLQENYPGANADHISAQRDNVLKDWNILQERALIRKQLLRSSCELQGFIASVRDLERWCDTLGSEIGTQEKVKDAVGVQELKIEHERLKAEIEARESDFNGVVQVGETLIKNGHYAADEIRAHVTQLLQCREALNNAWQLKNVYLDQLSDLHFFLRDVKQFEQLSAQQEHYLASHDLGGTVEEVYENVKKWEAFNKLLASQDEKLAVLMQSGDKLLAQNHFDSENIRKRMNELTLRRNKVKDLSKKRQQRLNEQLQLAQFRRDVLEAEAWIEERHKRLEADKFDSRGKNLKEKVKQLQKHQAFQAELTAHSANITTIKQKGETLMSKHHEGSVKVSNQLKRLMSKWSELLSSSSERGRGLEEAQDILEFDNQVAQVEFWIRDKELLIQVGDTGKDYEHCLSLIRKLDDVDSNMRVDEGRIKAINALADKLIRQKDNEECLLQKARRDELNEKWRNLQGSLEAYRAKIQGVLEVHRFNHDLDDLDERISEKMAILNKEDDPKNLEAVEALQRKQDAIECDMSAIEARLREMIDVEGRKLFTRYPDMVATSRQKLNTAQDNWRKLTQSCNLRRQKLTSAYLLNKFLTELNELDSWSSKLIEVGMARLQSSFTSTADVKNELELHAERKAEIDGRQESFKNMKDFGYKLLRIISQQKEQASQQVMTPNYQAKLEEQEEVIKKGLDKLEEIRNSLNLAWAQRKSFFTQCLQLQIFQKQTEQAESWLSTKEAFFNNEDLGDSISSVDTLIRKHDNFEKTMLAQNRIQSLEKYSNELIAAKHFDSESIGKIYNGIGQRRKRLIELASQRRAKLQDSKKYQQFLRTCHEVLSWLNKKMKIATDENYRDSTNLLSKIQKHAAFEAEMVANKGRIDGITNEGEALIEAHHFMSEEISKNLKLIETNWRLLNEEATKKKQRLQDAFQGLQFHRMCDDLDNWMNDIESALSNEDHGKDIISCQNLLKKHHMLEVDVNNHGENIEQVKDLALNFAQNNHFLKDEIQERSVAINTKYASLHEPVQIRRENLEDALVQHQFKHDVEDEIDWLNEKESHLINGELGSSLAMVQNLQKKHSAYEAEISAREQLITALIKKGWNLIKSKHFASTQIEELILKLQNKLQLIKDEAAKRKTKLESALEAQQFYSEFAEAQTWCKEIIPFLTCDDNGKDESSALNLSKKLAVVERDIERYLTGSLSKLVSYGRALIEKGNYDSENIDKSIDKIEKQFKKIEDLFERRAEALNESKKRFAFLRDADELTLWIKDQLMIASSEDYGQDVEHVELLIQRFDNFITSLHANKIRIENFVANSKEMDDVDKRVKEVIALWEELEECSQSRLDALNGAKQVHTFDRSADETIAWIHEKDSSVILDETIAMTDDLESIQAMGRTHKGFESDLAAVREQVEALFEEAKRLQALFPDAKEHIEVKYEQVAEEWKDLLQKSAKTKTRLEEAETLHTYFDEYRELMSWINEIMAMITADDDLANRDVSGAEIQLNRHMHEYKAEIDMRKDAIGQFIASGQKIITNKHFMSDEVNEKISRLQTSWEQLNEVWRKRFIIYKQNLDYLMFKRDIDGLNSWLNSRKVILEEHNLGDSIAAVEELIRKYEDFEKTILAQEEKLEAIKRVTLIEDMFRKQKKEEEELKKNQELRKEQEKFEHLKKKEQKRILEERKKEEERRKNSDGVITKLSESEGGFGFVRSLMGPKGVKRAESVKFSSPKRTPSFTTRRRSFRTSRSSEQAHDPEKLPPVEIEGLLERKHELQSGGKRAAIRSWKNYYTVLCGQLLCFFKDKQAFVDNIAASSPVCILHAECAPATDYTKRKHVFRLRLTDMSEYLFATHNESTLNEWYKKIAFHASLQPSMQLLSYDKHKNDNLPTSDTKLMPISENKNGFSKPTNESSFLPSSETKNNGPCVDLENKRPPPSIPSNASLPQSRSSMPFPVSEEDKETENFKEQKKESEDVKLKVTTRESIKEKDKSQVELISDHKRNEEILQPIQKEVTVKENSPRGPPPLPPPRTSILTPPVGLNKSLQESLAKRNSRPELEMYENRKSDQNERNGSNYCQSYSPTKQDHNNHYSNGTSDQEFGFEDLPQLQGN